VSTINKVEPSPSATARGFHDLVVCGIEQLTGDAYVISLEVPDTLRPAYTFRAGQHLTFRLFRQGAEVRRSFSICTTPASGRLEVAVRLLPTGIFSRFVEEELKVGDTLSVMTPAGRFGVRPALGNARRRYGAVVAGSGITPVMSIITTILETEPDSEVLLIYGNRTAASVMFAEEIADLKDRFVCRLQVFHVFSREVQDAPLLSGRIDGDKLDQLLQLPNADRVDEWLLCGPAGLVEQTLVSLLSRGVERRQIHTELFYTGPVAPVQRSPDSARLRSQVTARLFGRTTTFAMPESGSILDAVLQERPDAPFACKGGVCGTCRVRVTAGEVEMVRNFVLDQHDLDQNFSLACQSVPRSATVAIDFDV
jgi:ring-1,2-phenylacetyl-CoA epoxidase subunit PaaE